MAQSVRSKRYVPGLVSFCGLVGLSMHARYFRMDNGIF